MIQKKLLVISTFLALMLVACPPVLFASKTETPTLTLSAHATLNKPSDELQLKIGVINVGDTAEETLFINSAKMQTVIENLEDVGLTNDEYETGKFSIHPTYTPYPKDAPSDWKPSINGYEVSNSITIHTDKLDIAGKLIDVANKAGANSISDVRFGLREPRIYWSEALSAATTNAISDAKAIAAAAKVKLVRIISIHLDNTHVVSHQVNAAYLAKAIASDNAPPLEPGEVKITANMTLVYEISSK